MGNPYPAQFTDDEGEARLTGEIAFTDQANQPGGSQPLTGDGSPIGVVTPSGPGVLYIDTTSGAEYISTGSSSAEWAILGGEGTVTTGGVISGADHATLVEPGGAQVQVMGGNVNAAANGAGSTAQLQGNQGSGVEVTDNGAATTLGFYGAAPVLQPAVTGALSTVLDAPAKAVLTSIIAALVGLGLATNGTT